MIDRHSGRVHRLHDFVCRRQSAIVGLHYIKAVRGIRIRIGWRRQGEKSGTGNVYLGRSLRQTDRQAVAIRVACQDLMPKRSVNKCRIGGVKNALSPLALRGSLKSLNAVIDNARPVAGVELERFSGYAENNAEIESASGKNGTISEER